MNINKRTMAILILAMSLVISGCGSEGLSSPTITPPPPPTETPNPTPVGGGGGQLLFLSNRDGTGLFYTLDINDLKVSLLTDNRNWSGFKNIHFDSDPSLSPDGNRIVFSSRRDDPDPDHCLSNMNCNYDLYIITAGNSQIIRLTNESMWDMEPAWSPDGKRIAFISDRDNENNIYVMNADGSNVKNLTKQILSTEGYSSHAPTWSPDGKHIAFIAKFLYSQGIYIINPDGTNMIKLTDLPDFNCLTEHISWSPDGKHIVFVSNVDGLGIYVMDANGSNVTRLTDNTTCEASPSWSPDGKLIVFTSNRENPDKLGSYLEIYVMNADGSHITRLTDVSAIYRNLIWMP